MKLSQIHSPQDIRLLTTDECEELADDLRSEIIHTVSQNGGHLASNLGIVEITLALHRVFDTPRDKIVFDVGHQTYAHKLITGRYEQFHTIRCYDGLSGFPRRSESEYDCFEAGHASTSVSAALGMARARDIRGEDYHVVAVIGDGALTGGLSYEALNDGGKPADDKKKKTKLIVVLNDNGMSIAKNVGALSRYLYKLRATKTWHTTKTAVKSRLNELPVIGKPLFHVVRHVERLVKNIFLNEGFFTTLGYHYLGPVDGNNISALEKVFEQAKKMDEPVLIHCITIKGCGYHMAENEPETFHGISPFCVENGEINKQSSQQIAWGKVANECLCELAQHDGRITAITAAMPKGSSTSVFKTTYPDRFFDVGIAEEHAVTLCGGMASGGLRPFFFVYSTFMQRAYDQALNDIATQKLPVVFMLDHAGFSDEDGQTHHGLYDITFMRHIPNMTVLAPGDTRELREMLHEVLKLQGPVAIRYPKSASGEDILRHEQPFRIGSWTLEREGDDGVILAIGPMLETALRVADWFREERKFSLRVVNASSVKPLDDVMLNQILNLKLPVVTMEEHVIAGGFGSAVLEYAAQKGFSCEIHLIGVDDCFVTHGSHRQVLISAGLDTESVIRKMLQWFGSREV